ncbi:hypothetical protein [uncultured Bartonella sp.]|uniref:hypothetical protein n=1 Tax=uncultured Bartonella sp. TaxID=104108 RepID=UPI00261BD723|nr:hypothetical protein [uncultured Bartonella sp.]
MDNTQQIYTYKPETREFSGRTFKTPSPANIDDWLMPAFTTETPPPETKEHEVAIWNGEKWTIQPDYRGQTWYDKNGNGVLIKDIGVPASGLTTTKPETTSRAPAFPPLTARQFWQAALVIGVKEEDLVNGVADEKSPFYVADKEERESVLIDITKATTFSYDFPLLKKIVEVAKMPKDQFDTLWQWAANMQ